MQSNYRIFKIRSVSDHDDISSFFVHVQKSKIDHTISDRGFRFRTIVNYSVTDLKWIVISSILKKIKITLYCSILTELDELLSFDYFEK